MGCTARATLLARVVIDIWARTNVNRLVSIPQIHRLLSLGQKVKVMRFAVNIYQIKLTVKDLVEWAVTAIHTVVLWVMKTSFYYR